MRTLDPAVSAALAAGVLVPRDFIWFMVRDRITAAIVTDGVWSGLGNVAANVINPNTGATELRNFAGSQNLVKVGEIALVSNLTIQTATITLNKLSTRINDLVRTYEPKQGGVEIYRGLFSASTRQLVAPAVARFVGFIDDIEIETPAANEEGAVNIICKSYTQEMTRWNTDTRSHESQIRRSATDNFFQGVEMIADDEHFWGAISGKAPVAAAKGSAQSNAAGAGSSVE